MSGLLDIDGRWMLVFGESVIESRRSLVFTVIADKALTTGSSDSLVRTEV